MVTTKKIPVIRGEGGGGGSFRLVSALPVVPNYTACWQANRCE